MNPKDYRKALEEENAALKKSVADWKRAYELERAHAEKLEQLYEKLRKAVEDHWAEMVDSGLYKVMDEVTQSTKYTPGRDR